MKYDTGVEHLYCVINVTFKRSMLMLKVICFENNPPAIAMTKPMHQHLGSCPEVGMSDYPGHVIAVGCLDFDFLHVSIHTTALVLCSC